MKYIFSTGEILYARNKKHLEQGLLEVECLYYTDISQYGEYEAVGTLNGVPATVKFKISQSSFADISFKHSVRILMQSDLLQAEWESYRVE